MKSLRIQSIGILGAGTWGMALARMLSNMGHDVTVWSALESEIDNLSENRRQPNLPEMVIPDSLKFSKNIEDAIVGRNILLMAVPSIFIRQTTKQMAPFIKDGQILVCVAKGIELESLSTMTTVIKDELGAHFRSNNLEGIKLVAFSGPTHAEEVALDLPTAIVAASEDREAAEIIQNSFSNENMRVYTNPDVEGVELCGAMKNVIALAVGISTGLGYQDNAKAALITRGMEEIKRLGVAMRCEEDTFFGLAGIGDLIVTATSEHSRNNRCGQLIGKGYSPENAVKEVGMVVEGLYALPAVLKLAEKYDVEVPISQALSEIVYNDASPESMVKFLMGREKKPEHEVESW